VLKYLDSPDFAAAFDFVDFVIVQIDTDVCDQKPFDVQKLPIDDLWDRVQFRLAQQIGEELFEQHKSKIIFAISIHSMECWMLSLISAKASDRKKVEGCLGAPNAITNTWKPPFTIDPANKNHGHYYDRIMSMIEPKRGLPKRIEQDSLKHFWSPCHLLKAIVLHYNHHASPLTTNPDKPGGGGLSGGRLRTS
jgi:hypothetical protein